MVATIFTVPRQEEMSKVDRARWSIDFASVVAVADTLTNPTAHVYDQDTGTEVAGAIMGTPSITGKLVNAQVDGSTLTVAKRYHLDVTADATSIGTLGRRMEIYCRA